MMIQQMIIRGEIDVENVSAGEKVLIPFVRLPHNIFQYKYSVSITQLRQHRAQSECSSPNDDYGTASGGDGDDAGGDDDDYDDGDDTTSGVGGDDDDAGGHDDEMVVMMIQVVLVEMMMMQVVMMMRWW